MGSIDQPPEILGAMIGSALVGTFLGVLLAYGFVGPFAARARTVIESDAAIYHTVKQLIIASLHGHPQPPVIEAARPGGDHANQHGRASCRERVGPYVEICVVAVSLKQNTYNTNHILLTTAIYTIIL